MPWWVYAIGAWISVILAFCWGWAKFFRAIREWEDERYERFGMC